MEKIKGWETKTMTRLFRFRRHDDKTCGEAWDGFVMKNRMLWLIHSKQSVSGEVRDRGAGYKPV